jgi:branched-chain amino acid transport system substrate-binding protein
MPKILFGMAVSLTGRYALLGKQVLAGAQSYVNWVNAAGGLSLGENTTRYEIELHYIDDKSDASTMEEHLDRLFAKYAIDILLGPYGSGLGLAAGKYAENHHMVLWNHSSSADEIFSSGFKWMVGIISPASQYFSGVLQMSKQANRAFRKVALVNANTGFAQDIAKGVVEWAGENGWECIQFTYPSGLNSFYDVIAQVQNAMPDVLLGVGRVEDDIQFAKNIVEKRLNVGAVGLVVAAIDEFKLKLKHDCEGFFAPSQWEAGASLIPTYGPTSSEFVELYRRQAGNLPLDYPAAQGFVGGLIAGRCVELAGSLDQSRLRETASDLDCTTFYGRCLIAPNTGKQIGREMLVTQWQQGEKQIVWPPTVAGAQFRRR